MKEFIINDVIYRVGTSAKDNTQLIKDSEANWTWFHLEKFPSCHVVICKGDCNSIEIDIAANLVKDNSKYKFKHIGVNYCTINNLIHCDKPGAVSFISTRKVKTIHI
jgi:hypothetical protein